MEAADMSLDTLIKRDKEEKHKKYQQQREQRTEQRGAPRHKRIHKGNRPPRRQRSRSGDRHQGHNSRSPQPQPPQRRLQDRLAARTHPSGPPPERYTLLIRGFVADISTEDIYNILKGRKVLSIKTFLSSDAPLEYSKEMPIDVKITFTNKEDADSLMKEYSNKVLDGKRTLEFSFVRG